MAMGQDNRGIERGCPGVLGHEVKYESVDGEQAWAKSVLLSEDWLEQDLKMSQSQPGQEILLETSCGSLGAAMAAANGGEGPVCDKEEVHMQPWPAGDPEKGLRAELKQEPKCEGDPAGEPEKGLRAELKQEPKWEGDPAGEPEKGLRAELKQEPKWEGDLAVKPEKGLRAELKQELKWEGDPAVKPEKELGAELKQELKWEGDPAVKPEKELGAELKQEPKWEGDPAGEPEKGLQAELKQEPKWEGQHFDFDYALPLLGSVDMGLEFPLGMVSEEHGRGGSARVEESFDDSVEAESTSRAAAAKRSVGPLCKEEEELQWLPAELKQEQEGEPLTPGHSLSGSAEGLKIQCVWSMATKSGKVWETLRHHGGSMEDGGVQSNNQFSPRQLRASRRLRSEENEGPTLHLKQEQNAHPLSENMAECSDSDPEIFRPTKRTKSEVWSHFGFYKSDDGNLLEDKHPVCKTCRKEIPAKGGNTSNLLSHLRLNHPLLYSECKPPKEYLEQIPQMSDGSEASMSCIESSDDEHIPSKEPIHGSSSEGSRGHMTEVPLVKLNINKSQSTKTLASTSSDKNNRRSESENSNTNPRDVSVLKLQKKKNGARAYSKKHYCLYCSIHCHKIARHLIRKHSGEMAVAQAMAFPLTSKERKLHFDLIRNKGNHAHNNEVLKAGSGTLIPSQQTKISVKPSDYMYCINCEAFLKRKSLQGHMSRCRLPQKCSATELGQSRIQSLGAYAQPVPDGVGRKLWELVNAMHQSEVTNIIRREKSILRLGEHLYAKHGHDQTKHEYIRQKMREIGRLICHSQKSGKLKRIEDFYVPSNFNFVVEAVKDVAGFDEDKNIYKIPSLALKLGHSLKKIADILECDALMAESDNEEFIKNLQRSRSLYEEKWDVCVSSHAKTLREGKWNTPQLLPFTEDVKLVHMHLDKCRQEYQTTLENDPNTKNWSKLASLTLCEVILFNRRREDEVSMMPLSAFNLRDTSGVHSDLALGLSELEKKLCQHFQCVEIRDKRNRKVPILLTADMLTSMEALVAHRRACGVPDENPFFFSRPEAETHLKGSDAIWHIARECGAKHPETLSSTKLRKLVSTLSMVLNLRDDEMDILANFIGHDIQVHREYYRLPEGTLQLAKVSKVLIALEQGRLSDFKGMDLDQINIDPNEEVPEAIDSDLSEAEKDSSSSGASIPKRRKKMEESETCDLKTETSKKRYWSSEEVHAVEKTLMSSIESGKVPGKSECVACIEASPETLENRSWTSVKFYVKNRITAVRRGNARRIS